MGFPSGLVVKNPLAPHERLPEVLVVPREKTPTGAVDMSLSKLQEMVKDRDA